MAKWIVGFGMYTQTLLKMDALLFFCIHIELEILPVSFGVNENFFLLFLFFELAVALPDAHVLLLPIFCADWVPSCLNNHAFESIDSFAHFLVQLLLH